MAVQTCCIIMLMCSDIVAAMVLRTYFFPVFITNILINVL